MSVVLAEKVCTKCGETKPLTEFYRNRAAKDGRHTACGSCHREQVNEWKTRRREEMGEEAWLEYVRNKTQKSRAKTDYRVDRLQQAAYQAAERRVREAHRDEFEAYYREERYERGLSV